MGFKARVGSAYSLFCGGECNIHSPRSTSGATHADLFAASTQPVTSQNACAEVELGPDSNGQSPGQNLKNACKYGTRYASGTRHIYSKSYSWGLVNLVNNYLSKVILIQKEILAGSQKKQ